MYYVVNRGEILAAASFSNPGDPGRKWLPGRIAHFETISGRLPGDLDDAFLVNASGEAWHIEILGISPFARAIGRPLPGGRDGVTVRLLRQLQAHEGTLAKVRQHHHFQRAGALGFEQRGAA